MHKHPAPRLSRNDAVLARRCGLLRGLLARCCCCCSDPRSSWRALKRDDFEHDDDRRETEVADGAPAIQFDGRIVEGQAYYFASFPGACAREWWRVTEVMRRKSVACVFLPGGSPLYRPLAPQ